MNILRETESRMNYQFSKLADLESVDKKKLTLDARIYIRKEVDKTRRNIEYYSGLIKQLEKENK